MAITYKRLWKLFIDQDMSKKQLERIYMVLNCRIEAVLEFTPDED